MVLIVILEIVTLLVSVLLGICMYGTIQFFLTKLQHSTLPYLKSLLIASTSIISFMAIRFPLHYYFQNEMLIIVDVILFGACFYLSQQFLSNLSLRVRILNAISLALISLLFALLN